MLKEFTKKDLLRLGSAQFDPFPAWVEINPRYACSEYSRKNPIRAVVVSTCDNTENKEAELYTSGGNFSIDGYGISWRMWYASGLERPNGEKSWGRFSWDTIN